MNKRYYQYLGSRRFVRSPSGTWYFVFQRDGAMVTNSNGTTFYRMGSEVWKDIPLTERNQLERMFVESRQAERKVMKEEDMHWLTLIRVLINDSMIEDNENKAELAGLLDGLRIASYQEKLSDLDTLLDKTSV